MNRGDKIRLIKDLATGKKNLNDLRTPPDLSKLTKDELYRGVLILKKYGAGLIEDLKREPLSEEERGFIDHYHKALRERPTGYGRAFN